MARRLKIHHNTVSRVYQELVDRNLLVRRRGSRMAVRTPGELEHPPAVKDLDDLINTTVQAALQHGYSYQQLRQRVQERLMAQPPDHILVISTYPGMRHLLQEEFREELSFPTKACSPDELSSNPELAIGALVAAAPGAIPKIASSLPKDHPAIPIVFSEADEHLEMIRQLREPSSIAVISISKFFLRTARGVLAPAIGQHHTTREYLLSGDSCNDLGAHDLAFCDSIARRRVKFPKLVHYRLVSASCLEQLSNAMTAGNVTG